MLYVFFSNWAHLHQEKKVEEKGDTPLLRVHASRAAPHLRE